ncbi:MAG: cobalamin-binding protein [Gammaproteobacteria bacterium]|nr:cobalamin-binding protein [Gammaproteobacteria bacterium]
MWHRLLILSLASLSLTANAIEVSDSQGRKVVLAQPAQRIVSLAPHVTEMLFSAGAGNQVVGVVKYSDYPEQAKTLPQVGGYTRLDVEAILALKPDLVVAWFSGNKGDAVKQLATFGIPVYYTEPRQLKTIARDIRNLGLLGGSYKIANVEADRLLSEIVQLRKQYQGRRRIKVFYQIWDRPMMTINGEHLINEVIELCGGINVFAESSMLIPKVGVEAVLKAQPEAIIASGMATERPEWLDEWRQWPDLAAVQTGALFSLQPAIIQRQGPRIIIGARRICEQLDSVRQK